MSKGLEAFNRLENLLKELIKEITLDQTLVLGECIKAIEQELKRLEKIDNEPYIPLHINRYYELSKKEDVLEIIIAKRVDFDKLSCCCNYIEYNTEIDIESEEHRTTRQHITSEEYDMFDELGLIY